MLVAMPGARRTPPGADAADAAQKKDIGALRALVQARSM